MSIVNPVYFVPIKFSLHHMRNNPPRRRGMQTRVHSSARARALVSAPKDGGVLVEEGRAHVRKLRSNDAARDQRPD